MLFYVTYNDLPSGIFSSQVIDVVKFFKSNLKTECKLIAFISLRSFFVNRKKIKIDFPQVIVIPMFPGVHRWRFNYVSLCLLTIIYKPTIIIGRSVFATQLALLFQKNKIKVVYDGRAAVTAEWQEYNVGGHSQFTASINELEKQAVLFSDFRIAVSQALVKHWYNAFNYRETKHVVIPCTLNNQFENIQINNTSVNDEPIKLGYMITDIVFVYAGSLAGWQSVNLLADYVRELLLQNKNYQVLFLSDTHQMIEQLKREFPNQVQNIKVPTQVVPHYLLQCDYGLLIREQSITNKVASPVKFAEYLACGLDVIISEQLGDYTEFVLKHQCGFIYTNGTNFPKPSFAKKQANNALANQLFSKKQFLSSYQQLLALA